MSNRCSCCSKSLGPDITNDETDPVVLQAASILVDMSRLHIESTDSSTCKCTLATFGELPSMKKIMDDADNDPQTEIEDWEAMGNDHLRMRVGGERELVPLPPTNAGLEKEAGSQKLKHDGIKTDTNK